MRLTKIALLGATSKTGIELIKLYSVVATVEVYAFVRNAEKLESALVGLPENLKIIPFDIRGDDGWKVALSECELWISIVGISGLLAARKPNKLYENTGSLLVNLAEQFNPHRVFVITSGGVVESVGEPWILKKVLKPFFLNPMYDDMRKMEEIIVNSSMNYTIVRPPYLTNGKMVGEYRMILDRWFDDDKVLSRKDLAHFLFNGSTLLDEKLNKRIVGISY